MKAHVHDLILLTFFLSPFKHGNQLKKYTETFSIFSSPTSIFDLLPMLIIFNQWKKISFLISTGKAEKVSCTIISNSVKSPVGHKQCKKIQNSPSTIFGQSNASNQSPWQQIRSFDQFFFTEFTFLITENSEMEMKTIKCLSLLLRVFVSKVNADYISAMPLISFVFIVVNERQCQRSNPILSFHNPVYTTFNCVPVYINSILLASFV